MTKAEAYERVYAELNKVWPGWEGHEGQVGNLDVRLDERGDLFDYSFVSAGSRLQIVVSAVHIALGLHAGVLLSSG